VVKIDEPKLDKMIEFDNGLFDEVAKIVDETSAFKKEVMGHDFNQVTAHIKNLNAMVEELEESFDSREGIIMGVT